MLPTNQYQLKKRQKQKTIKQLIQQGLPWQLKKAPAKKSRSEENRSQKKQPQKKAPVAKAAPAKKLTAVQERFNKTPNS